MLPRIQDILSIVPEPTDALHDQSEQALALHRGRVLSMFAIRDIGESRYAFAAFEGRANLSLDVDVGHQFPVAQIFDRLVAKAGVDAIGDARTFAPFVEPEDKSRPIGRPAVMVRINAQASSPSRHHRSPSGAEIEAGPPDQRAIAENPHVATEIGRRARYQNRAPSYSLHAHPSPSCAALRPKSGALVSWP